jgi:hypothetical protein
MTRSEHAAEGRQHHVEARVLERQRLGIALAPFHLQALRLRRGPSLVEQLWDQVESGRPSAGARDRQRRVAGPAGDVEDLVADRRPDALDDPLADIEDQLGDRAEVAGRPHRPLTLLDLVSQLSVHAPTAP